jgi:nucleotide-binding universal stress UspA family protein
MQNLVFTRPLLATEHSEHDTGSERVAIELARHCALPLAVVMPIVSNPEYEATTPEVAGRVDAAIAERRRAFVAEAQAAGVATELRTRHGLQPWREIVEHAKELGADLLVIRRRGRPGLLANLLIGDMVSKVLSHAPCPVLVCPRTAGMWQRRVLAAVAPGGRDAAVLHTAAEVARACALPLTVLRIGGEGERAELEAMAAPLRAAGMKVDIELRGGGSPHRAIVDGAQAQGADLLVVGAHGGELLGRAWIGGVAQKVIGLSESAVLVIPPGPSKEKPSS